MRLRIKDLHPFLREIALKEAKEYRLSIPLERKLEMSIQEAFVWSGSKNGREFWSLIYKTYDKDLGSAIDYFQREKPKGISLIDYLTIILKLNGQ